MHLVPLLYIFLDNSLLLLEIININLKSAYSLSIFSLYFIQFYYFSTKS